MSPSNPAFGPLPVRLPVALAAACTLAATLLAPAASSAHPALLGGFHPVASEQSARALWVNPAAVGVTGMGTASAELILDGEDAVSTLQAAGSGGDLEIPSHVRGFSLAASTDRLGYGFQAETSDAAGIPDWTFAMGNGVPLGGRGRIGVTAEWRGGDDSGLDATAGLLLPVSRELTLAAVARDLLARDVDGAEGQRSWQFGAAIPFPSILGTFTWDAVVAGGEAPDHWFSFSIDRSRYAHASVARSLDGDWSLGLDLVFPNSLLGIGAVERPGGAHPDRAFVTAEWRGRQFPGTYQRP